MRIMISVLVAFFLVLGYGQFFAGAVNAAEFIEIDVANANKGIVAVAYNGENSKALKVMVQKDQQKYAYNLVPKKKENFPLQMGNGQYKIMVLENVSGNSYKVLTSKDVSVKLVNNSVVFLQSVQNVNWNDDLAAIKKAKQIVAGSKNDAEKVQRLYNYIVKNVSYDFTKARTVKSGYVPSVNEVFLSNKGICYDYSALFASMLRELGIPAKLVMGYAPNVKEYHAWNEVLINGKWVVIDTTSDAQLLKAKKNVSMIKAAKGFKVEKVY